MLLLFIVFGLQVIAVNCTLLSCYCCVLHLAPVLLLCIACCRHIVAVHCTLYPCYCCALHLAFKVLRNKVFAKRQAFLANEDARSGISNSQCVRAAGIKLRTSLLSHQLDGT